LFSIVKRTCSQILSNSKNNFLVNSLFSILNSLFGLVCLLKSVNGLSSEEKGITLREQKTYFMKTEKTQICPSTSQELIDLKYFWREKTKRLNRFDNNNAWLNLYESKPRVSNLKNVSFLFKTLKCHLLKIRIEKRFFFFPLKNCHQKPLCFNVDLQKTFIIIIKCFCFKHERHKKTFPEITYRAIRLLLKNNKAVKLPFLSFLTFGDKQSR
jgi:hypothetical protein